jgi:hypothetical protein
MGVNCGKNRQFVIGYGICILRGYLKSLSSPFGTGAVDEGLVKEHKLRKYFIRQNALTLTLSRRERGLLVVYIKGGQ